jgi:hypothetical protein
MTQAPQRTMASLWVAAFGLSFVLVGLGLVRVLDATGEALPPVDIDAMSQVEQMLGALGRRPARSRELRIAFLGDSTAMHFADPSRGVDRRLEPELARLEPAGTRPRVFSFVSLGFTPFTYYFLAHRIAAARPDRVILALNLHAFSDQWRAADRPRLAGWIPVRQLAEALRLPLHWIGLGADELLLYTGLVRAGDFEAWLRLTREQARCVRAWQRAEAWLQARSPWPGGLGYRLEHFAAQRASFFLPGVPERETSPLAQLRLNPVLAGIAPDHPVLEVLTATLEAFEARGIDVLVYVVPVNVEHHERLGLYRRDALRPAIATVQRVVEESGASFLDLSTLLPDAAFADGSSHLTVGDPIDAPPLVIRQLALALVREGNRPSPR